MLQYFLSWELWSLLEDVIDEIVGDVEVQNESAIQQRCNIMDEHYF